MNAQFLFDAEASSAPEEVAQTVLFLASSASSYGGGMELNVEGGLGQV